MCQLLGISANKPVNMRCSLREWRHRGNCNPHGYGFAFWTDREPRIIKEAARLFDAYESQDQVERLTSSTFLCHVRLASVGKQDGTNTHPFRRNHKGHDIIFAHNGTVDKDSLLLSESEPEGSTDSEHAFLWLLQSLPSADESTFSEALKSRADDVRATGRFNCLMSDGDRLWAYAHNSLCYADAQAAVCGFSRALAR